MSCGEYESYILKDKEMKLLLAGLGMKQLYGILDSDGAEEITRESKNRVLLSLYQKEVIDFSDGEISIRPGVSDLFRTLLESRECVSVHVRGQDMPVRCGYVSNGWVVMMERCQRRKGALKLSFWTQAQWILFLESLMGEIVSECEQVLKNFEKEETAYRNDAEEYFRSENVAAVFTRQDSGKMKIRQRILIKESGLETCMVFQNANGCFWKPYKQKELMRAVAAWMEGKDGTGGYLYSGD